MYGILEQILKYPVHPLAVGHDHHRCLRQFRAESDFAACNLLFHIRQSLAQQLTKVQFLHMHGELPGCCLAHGKHVLHHVFQPLGFFIQDFHIVPHMLRQFFLFFQELHIADDGGKRRLDVMGDIGDQFHFHAFALHLLVHGDGHAVPDVFQFRHGVLQVMA